MVEFRGTFDLERCHKSRWTDRVEFELIYDRLCDFDLKILPSVKIYSKTTRLDSLDHQIDLAAWYPFGCTINLSRILYTIKRIVETENDF